MSKKPIPSSMMGHVDQYSDTVISGWLVDFANPSHHLQLKILVDGVFVCDATANEYRGDLAKNEAFEETNHAFTVTLPASQCNGKTRWVKVVESETGYVLNNSPAKVKFAKTKSTGFFRKLR